VATGARQFVVHDALEITSWWSGSYASSLTPTTTVTSGSFAGAETITFRARDDLSPESDLQDVGA
jgi:hypothetical protein